MCRAQLAVTAEYTHDMTVVSRLNPMAVLGTTRGLRLPTVTQSPPSHHHSLVLQDLRLVRY
jgi:hypothetical protein